jgi:hypothetical protein
LQKYKRYSESSKRTKKKVNFNSFSNRQVIKEGIGFEGKCNEFLKRCDVSYYTQLFNSGEHHSNLDETSKIVKYDYVWLDEFGQIVAFHNHKDQTLYC